MFPNWAKNILFLLIYMISGLVLVIIIEGLLSGTSLLPFNTVIESTMTAIRTPFLTNSMVVITNMGSPFVLGCLSIILAVILTLKDRTSEAIVLLSTMIVATLAFTILKNVFQISRPSSDIIGAIGYSFPSGHATIATTFFFILAHAFWRDMKSAWEKVSLTLACTIGAAMVCFSRLYLGAHWALDILGGISLGFLCVSFSVLLSGFFIMRRNRHERFR